MTDYPELFPLIERRREPGVTGGSGIAFACPTRGSNPSGSSLKWLEHAQWVESEPLHSGGPDSALPARNPHGCGTSALERHLSDVARLRMLFLKGHARPVPVPDLRSVLALLASLAVDRHHHCERRLQVAVATTAVADEDLPSMHSGLVPPANAPTIAPGHRRGPANPANGHPHP